MRFFKLIVFAISMAFPGSFQVSQAADVAGPPITQLDVDDISLLFPMPEEAKDLDNVISLKDVLGASGPVWPESAMTQYFTIVGSEAGKVAGTGFAIGLPDGIKNLVAWHVAAIRIDPGAPGLSEAIVDQFGSQPQIRLIAQPVIKDSDGKLEVLDIAAHLIFSFVTGANPPAQEGCLPRSIPDVAKRADIAADALDLKVRLAYGQIGGHEIFTAGVPLGVHPALKSKATASAFRGEVLAFLNRHLPGARLSSMAIAGIPGDDAQPWMFLAMVENPRTPGQFAPVPGPALTDKQFAEALSLQHPRGVFPPPAANNLNAITCKNAALRLFSPVDPLPVSVRKGLATAELIGDNPATERAKEIAGLIGDTSKSHFFNTDCVSCHTDTRLGLDLVGSDIFPGIDKEVLPHDEYNVRNFGWFPGEGPTATNRTLQETLDSLKFFNEHVLGK